MLGNVTCLVLVAILMVLPALWNGYPFIYFDSQDYVTMSFVGDVVVWRTMPYAIFLGIARLFDTLFAAVAVQSIIVTCFLHEFVAAFILRRQRWVFVGASVLMVTLTGLPWAASQILADVFAGLPALGLAVLAFGERLSTPRRLFLVPLIAVAVSTHLSHVAVASGLLLCLMVLWVGSRRWTSAPRPRLALVATSVAAGVVLVPSIHKMATGEAFFSRAGRVLHLALFIQDGLAQRYLNRVCPDGSQLILCPYADALPETADAFLWATWASPIDKVGGWSALKGDAAVIVPNVIAAFPLDVAKAAALNTVRQLALVSLGDGLVPMGKDSLFPFSAVYRWYPADVPSFERARQQEKGGIDVTALNAVQRPIALLAQAGLPLLCFIGWRRGDRSGAGMALIMILALVGNAVVCGALSNPHDRYQNRIVWVAVLTVVILPLRWYQLKTRCKSAAVGQTG